ncbi:MAG: ATP-binding protein, partial [Alphaproteobacteria bacterium]
MRCAVSNFRGIHTALIEAAPIALLCGQNGQGKSSIIEALGALLDGNQKPYGLTKDGLERLVHRGEQTGTVSITDDGRGMTVLWPSGDVSTEGAPFRATRY